MDASWDIILVEGSDWKHWSEGHETFTCWLVHLMSLFGCCFFLREDFFVDDPSVYCIHMFGEHLLCQIRKSANQLFCLNVQKFPLKTTPRIWLYSNISFTTLHGLRVAGFYHFCSLLADRKDEGVGTAGPSSGRCLSTWCTSNSAGIPGWVKSVPFQGWNLGGEGFSPQTRQH